MSKRVGLIADTHGLLRPEAVAALAGSDLIIHCGDVGGPHVIEALAELAPVIAIRGNVDRGAWADPLPETTTAEVESRRIYVLHDLKQLNIDPAADGYHAVVCGHSHKPMIDTRDGVLYVNPGSAGPRRFKLPVALARLCVSRQGIEATPIELSV